MRKGMYKISPCVRCGKRAEYYYEKITLFVRKEAPYCEDCRLKKIKEEGMD